MLILEVTMTKTRAGGCFRAPTNAGNYSAMPRYKADSRSVGKLPPRRRTAALWTPHHLLTLPTNTKTKKQSHNQNKKTSKQEKRPVQHGGERSRRQRRALAKPVQYRPRASVP